MQIRSGLLDNLDVQALLRLHLQGMRAQSPPSSVHAFDDKALRGPRVTFLTAWNGIDLLGCGALSEIDTNHGELKSMRTAPEHRRKGVAKALLLALIETARKKQLGRLSLETGTPAAFDAARAFYAKHGFEPCAAFADYRADDPYSTFMTRAI